MNENQEIETYYQKYLESNLHHEAGQSLVPILHGHGLEIEAKALAAYLEQGSGTTCYLPGDLWSDRICVISDDPPSSPELGDLWFDPVELSLAVFVPNLMQQSHHVAGWNSTHPVYVWQYRTFLRLMQIGKKTEIFETPHDYLSPARIELQKSLDFVVGVYHDEALAYSGWMGKSLCGQGDLKATKEQLSSAKTDSISPASLKVWESGEFMEGYRTAISLDTLDCAPCLGYENEDEDKELEADRILFDEWDRRSYIGLITKVRLSAGLSKALTTSTFNYEILNRILRPQVSGSKLS
jgi:hypothetical protein